MCKTFKCLPSDVLNIEDEYTAFCFNEACVNIIAHLQNEEKPHNIEQGREQKAKHYTTFSDFIETIK